MDGAHERQLRQQLCGEATGKGMVFWGAVSVCAWYGDLPVVVALMPFYGVARVSRRQLFSGRGGG